MLQKKKKIHTASYKNLFFFFPFWGKVGTEPALLEHNLGLCTSEKKGTDVQFIIEALLENSCLLSSKKYIHFLLRNNSIILSMANQ